MTTTGTCPNCGTTVTLPGMTLTNVTVRNNAMNIAAQCPGCGLVVDLAPNDGTYSTIAGRLTRVAENIAAMNPDQRAALRDELVGLLESDDAAQTAVRLTLLGAPKPAASWSSREGRMELYAIAALLIAVLTIVLTVTGGVSADDVQQIIEETAKNTPPSSPSAPPT